MIKQRSQTINMQIPDKLKYDEKGLIPAVIQDWKNGEVLMVAYMNLASLRKTIETRRTWFWSRSRQKFWQKGETSGNIQSVKDILYDCDQDTLLIRVEQSGPACHTGKRSCFYRSFFADEGEKS
jgi:phosphoribosyl-AMP cyclohydrolase